jgi:branched-chain amino acid transport system permease protein
MSVFVSFLVIGIVTGSIYAVTATGLVVTYNATGVFNFAHGSIGMFLAYVYWQLWQGWGWNPVVALVVVLLLIAPVCALLIERVLMRPLYGSSLNTMIVVTLGLFLVLYGLTSTIWNQTVTRNLPSWFAGDQVSVLGVNLTYEQLITVGCAVGVALALWLLFKKTRIGVAMRAVVDDPALASLTGARSGRIAGVAWTLGFMLAGLAGILLAPGTGMSIQILSELVIFGYAAAIVGRLRSLPLTFLGAMVLGIAGSLAVGYVPSSALNDVTAVLPMGLLILALIILPQDKLATGRVVRLRAPKAASLNQTLVGAVVLVGAAVLLSALLTGNNLYALGEALALGLAALSLVMLSGYGGQVWLCQFTFLGLGAWAMTKVDGGSSVLGVLAAIGLCAAAGGLLALPALRLRGLYMALATLAFAALMDSLFFTNASVIPNGSLTVGRPDIFGMRFTTTRAFVVLIAVVFAACLVGVGAVRRGSFGRRWVALSDSHAAAATVGVNIAKTKLGLFILAGALAGLAGVLYGGMTPTVASSQFQFVNSLVLFVGVVLAGVTILSGAVQAGVGLSVIPLIAQHIPSFAGFTYVLFGAGIIAVGRNPYGLGRLYAEVAAWREQRAAGAGTDGAPCAPPTACADIPVPPKVSSVG